MTAPDLRDLLSAMQHEQATPVSVIDRARIPVTPGAYAFWESGGQLIYVGLAGVRWTPQNPSPTSTLSRRIRDHLVAHRADVLTSYLFERRVCAYLRPEMLPRLASGEVSIRDLVRDYLEREVLVAWAETDDYLTAKALEDAARGGELGMQPLINPLIRTFRSDTT